MRALPGRGIDRRPSCFDVFSRIAALPPFAQPTPRRSSEFLASFSPLVADLRAQGREVAHVNTAEMDGNVQNTALT